MGKVRIEKCSRLTNEALFYEEHLAAQLPHLHEIVTNNEGFAFDGCDSALSDSGSLPSSSSLATKHFGNQKDKAGRDK